MRAYLLPIALQVLGMIVIVAEIFIPSLGLLSILAGGLLLYSLYLVFTSISFNAGMVLVGIDVVVMPIVLVLGLRALSASSVSLHKKLSNSEGVVSQSEKKETWLDREGEAVTDLRPSGTAMIEGKRLDVVTDGEYVDAGTRIRVTGVSGNRIVVDIIE